MTDLSAGYFSRLLNSKSEIAQSRPQLPFYGAAIAISLLFSVVSAYVVWQVRATDYASGARAAHNTAELVADDLKNSFDHLDGLMKSIGRLYVEGLDRAPEERARLLEYMKNEIADYPFVARILVSDSMGQGVLGSGAFSIMPNDVNISERTFFKRVAFGATGLIFEGPTKNKFTNEWVVVLARRLENAKGDFLGDVSAGIPVANFTKLFSTLGNVDHAVVSLRTDDGVLVARYTSDPEADGAVGSDVMSDVERGLVSKHLLKDHDVFESISLVDGVQRLVAYQKLPQAPFLVAVGQPNANLDESWRRLAIELGLLCLVVAIFALWTARRLQESEVRLRDDNRLLEGRVAARTQELDDERRRLRDFSNSTADWFWEVDEKLKFSFLSESFKSFNGLSARDLLGMPLAAIYAQDTLNPDEVKAEGLQRFAARKPFRDVAVAFKDEQGESQWFSASGVPIFDLEGVFTGYRGVAAIVTARKRAENELRQTKERLEAAAAAGIIGLWDCDFINKKFYWDNVMYQLYGVSENEFASPHDAFYACMHPDDKELVTSVFQQSFQGRKDPELDFRIIRPDGSIRSLRGLSRTIFGSDGKLERMVGVIYDVTDQKETLQALEQAKIQAEAASLAKSEFLANISHEIRTPLNAILGMTQVLARSGLNDEQTNCVRTLDSSAQNMLVLLTEVLDLSKIEAGQLELNEIPFSLAELIGSIANSFAVLAKNKGIALSVEPPPEGLPTLLGDSIRLGQVLTNLAGNAIKFTTRGGVTISVKVLDQSAETVRIRIVVRDTGIGITAEHIAKLFEPFVQADRTTYSRFGGTGLGLAISKRLVGLMGGAIGVESEPEKGSEFWLVVPFKTTSMTGTNEARFAAGHAKPLDGVRILVVDDTETNREIAIRLLFLEGAVCESAENGRTAIERLRANPGHFDLVLMDVQMADMDGLEATRVIRHDLGLTDLPVIALTAGAMPSQRQLALAAGMNGFVAKPFRLRELVAALSPWVRP
jgi:PAS domain S-box-containing protein